MSSKTLNWKTSEQTLFKKVDPGFVYNAINFYQIDERLTSRLDMNQCLQAIVKQGVVKLILPAGNGRY